MIDSIRVTLPAVLRDSFHSRFSPAVGASQSVAPARRKAPSAISASDGAEGRQAAVVALSCRVRPTTARSLVCAECSPLEDESGAEVSLVTLP